MSAAAGWNWLTWGRKENSSVEQTCSFVSEPCWVDGTAVDADLTSFQSAGE